MKTTELVNIFFSEDCGDASSFTTHENNFFEPLELDLVRILSRDDDWHHPANTENFYNIVGLVDSDFISPSLIKLKNISHNLTSQYELILNKIELFSSLEDGWDGEYSVAPENAELQIAKNLIHSLPAGIPLPSAMLNSTGEVGFYWSNDNGYIDIEIESSEQFSVYARERSGEKKEVYKEYKIDTLDADGNLSYLELLEIIK